MLSKIRSELLKSRVIVDTSLLVALMDEKDVWHAKATGVTGRLAETGTELIFLDCVVNETLTVLSRRLRERRGDRTFAEVLGKLRRHVTKENITWAYSAVRRLFDECMELVSESAGKLNFHDALIALVAKELAVPSIASFDRDFDAISWLQRVGEAPT